MSQELFLVLVLLYKKKTYFEIIISHKGTKTQKDKKIKECRKKINA